MSNVSLPIKPGASAGLTWPLYRDDKPVTNVDRSSRDDILSAVAPGVLLPSPQPLDYTLWAPHELSTPFNPLPLLEQQLSFFARHLAHEGPVPAELLQELLVEQFDQSAAAAAAASTAAAGANQLAALQVQLPVPAPCAASTPASATHSPTHQQQQQSAAGSGAVGRDQLEPAAAAPPGAAAALGSSHAGTSVLVVTVAGSARDQLVLTVLQPGAVPSHLTGSVTGAPEQGSGSPARRPHASTAGGGPPAAAATAAGLLGDAGSARSVQSGGQSVATVQLSAAMAAAQLQLGAPVHQVGLQPMPAAVSSMVQARLHGAAAPAAAAAARAQICRSSKQQQQQQAAVPVALVWMRCLSKVYAAAVMYTAIPRPAPAAATAAAARPDATRQQQQEHMALGHDEQQQQDVVTAQQPPGAGAKHPAVPVSGRWQLLLLGVASVPQQILTAEWHPLLPQAILGCQDGSIWLVTIQQALMSCLLDQHCHQQHQQAARHASAAAAPDLQQGQEVSLHPDGVLPKLLLQRQGALGWYQQAAAVQGLSSGAGAPAAWPLLLAAGAHPRQLLAACGSTLMRHDLLPASDSRSRAPQVPAAQQQRDEQQQDEEVLGDAAVSTATAGGGRLPGKLLMQLPAGEVVCAVTTWLGSQAQWQQAATAGITTGPLPAATAATAATPAPGCVHVRHLLAVATSCRLLLLDLRKAADEPLLVWQHSIGANGAAGMQPSLLLLLPTPPSEATPAASSCSEGCFAHRHAHITPPADAAGAGAGREAGTAADTCTPGGMADNSTAALPGAATAGAAGGASGGRSEGMTQQKQQPPGSVAGRMSARGMQGFDPAVYPSQMFQLGTESQGTIGRGLGEWAFFNTQASQIGDPAVGDLPPLQQQQQQQQQPLGASAAPARFPAPAAAAVGTAAATTGMTRPGVGLGSSSSSVRSGSAGQENELCGMIVAASGTSGHVHAVNFRLQWAPSLAPKPLPLQTATHNLTTKLQALAVTGCHNNSRATGSTAPAEAAAAAAAGSRAPASVAAGASAGAGAGPAAAAAAAASAANQQVPGTAALGFITRAMQDLAAASTAAVAAGGGAGAGAGAGGGGGGRAAGQNRRGSSSGGRWLAAAAAEGGSQQAAEKSPLGGWQLPSVVQITTPSPGQLLAQPVRKSVRSERAEQLRLQRAAAAAARGDPRSASEVGLLPGAALDISKAALAQQTLQLMAAAPDTQGLALCTIPWCWSGGTARALLLRSTADGDLCVQLCTTQQGRRAMTGREGVATGQQQQGQEHPQLGGMNNPLRLLRADAAAAAATATDGAAALLGQPNTLARQQQQQQQQSILRPLLEVVSPAQIADPPTAAAASAGSPTDGRLQQLQQQTAVEHHQLPLAAAAAVGAPAAQLQLVQEEEGMGSAAAAAARPCCVRSFEALQAWLDAAVEPPQLVTPAAVAKSEHLSYSTKRAEQRHVERQLVQLPAHTALVLALLDSAHPQQQDQQQEQQQQQLHEASLAQTSTSWPQRRVAPTAAGSVGAGAAAAGQALLATSYTLLQFEPLELHKRSAQTAAGAAQAAGLLAAATARDAQPATADVAQVLSEHKGPLTALELHHLLLQQQQQRAATSSKAPGSSRKRSRTPEALHGQQQQQQEDHVGHTSQAGASAAAAQQDTAAGVTNRRVLRSRTTRRGAAAAAAAAGAGTGGGRGLTGALTRLAKLRAATQQQQQQQEAGLRQRDHQPDAAVARGGDGATVGASAANHRAGSEGGSGMQAMDTAELTRLLQHQLPEPQLRLAAQLLLAAAQSSSLSELSSKQPSQQQQQQQEQPAGGRSTAGSGVHRSQLLPLMSAAAAAVGALKEQQQQRNGGQVDAASILQQYQMRQLTAPCCADAVGTAAGAGAALETGAASPSCHTRPATLYAAAGAAAAADSQPAARRYTVQPVGPGVWEPSALQGLALTGAPLAMTLAAGGADVVREVVLQQQEGLPTQQQRQGAQTKNARTGSHPDGAAGAAGAVGELFGTQTTPGTAAAGAGASGGVGSRRMVVSATYAPLGCLVERASAAGQLLDVTPRVVAQQQSQQQQEAGTSRVAAASEAGAAAAGAVLARGTPVLVPPGMLALAMSPEAQQRWLQLSHAWKEQDTALGAEASAGAPPVSRQQTQQNTRAAAGKTAAAASAAGAAAGPAARLSKLASSAGAAAGPARDTGSQQHKRPKHASQPGQQQQQPQQQQIWQGSGAASLAQTAAAAGGVVPVGQQRPQVGGRAPAAPAAAAARGSALLAALGGSRPSTVQQQQQQQLGGVHPLLPPLSQEQQHQSQQQQPQPPPASQSQQQQQQHQQGSLLSRLAQQQQQRRPGSGRGGSSMLMPSNRRR